MNTYLIAAYAGTTALYGGYLIWLLARQRSLKGSRDDDAR